MTGNGLTLALVGDVNCKADEGCRPALAPSVQEQLARADVRIGNLEGASPTRAWSCTSSAVV